jgi:hypothetical protein
LLGENVDANELHPDTHHRDDQPRTTIMALGSIYRSMSAPPRFNHAGKPRPTIN